MHLIRGNGLAAPERAGGVGHASHKHTTWLQTAPTLLPGTLHWVLLRPQVCFWTGSPRRSKVTTERRPGREPGWWQRSLSL